MELDLRGTEARTIRRYLASMGGVEQGPARMAGPGWRADLTEEIHRFGTWEFPRVLLRFQGEPEAVAEVVRRLRLMAFRGGA